MKSRYESAIEAAKSIKEPEVQMELLKMGAGIQNGSPVERLLGVIREKGAIGSRQAALRSLALEMATAGNSEFESIVKLAEEFDSLPDADGLRLDFVSLSQGLLSDDRIRTS
ncbi:MAG: hypothetical protein AAGG44_14680, partial [Planctomycetota bacterium]